MSIQFIGDDAASAVAKSRKLAEDLAHIAKGHAPSEADLTSAPILDHWEPIAVSRLALTGRVVGHPRLGDRPAIVTTEIFVLSSDWVRTWSRFYRLGRPALDHGRDQ